MSKRALLIGIGAGYPDPYKIETVNDLQDLGGTLIGKGFSCMVMMDAWATRDVMLAGLQGCVDLSQPGDVLVIAYVGHGTYITGPEPDGRTECLCPVDIDVQTGEGVITDDEIRAILSGLKPGVTLDFINGACFAGTSTRATAVAVTQQGKKKKNAVWQLGGMPAFPDLFTDQPKSVTVPVPGMNHCLWAASSEGGLSYGGIMNGVPRNIYIAYLCWALREYPAKTRSEIDLIVTQKVQAVAPLQIPQLEGTTAELAQLPFT